jgi:hypothetical protein
MSVLDELLPETTTEGLGALLERPEGNRPVEGLFFEFRSAWQTHQVTRSVAAFANAHGGFLFLGATATAGRLSGFPGLERGRDWVREVSNAVVGHISPLPAWNLAPVPSPECADRDVVVVRVPASDRTPHVRTADGVIYQRSPGGTSEPVKDRTTLDVLIARGASGSAAIRERIGQLMAWVPTIGGGKTDGYRIDIVAVPLPYGSVVLRELFTQVGYQRAPTVFHTASGHTLRGAVANGMVEDGIRLYFSERAGGTVHADGALCIALRSDSAQLSVDAVAIVVGDVLRAQAGLDESLHESHLLIRMQASGLVRLVGSREDRRPTTCLPRGTGLGKATWSRASRPRSTTCGAVSGGAPVKRSSIRLRSAVRLLSVGSVLICARLTPPAPRRPA